jgi:hypothetical protein
MSACMCAPEQSTSTGMDQSHPTALISSTCSQEVRGNTPYMRGLCRLGRTVITTLGVIRLPTVLVYAPVCTMSTNCPPPKAVSSHHQARTREEGGGVSLMRNIFEHTANSKDSRGIGLMYLSISDPTRSPTCNVTPSSDVGLRLSVRYGLVHRSSSTASLKPQPLQATNTNRAVWKMPLETR